MNQVKRAIIMAAGIGKRMQPVTLYTPKPMVRLIQLMWCILLILLPMALIFAESSMNNLQSVSIVAAFPIAIVIILIIASFLKDAGKYMDEK